MKNRPLLLGSNSPRRKEILSFFSLPFKQLPSHFDDTTISFKKDPASYVKQISDGKALTLASLYPQETILTADTVVYREGKVYGKPQNLQELKAFLKELQGSWHTVWTGVSLFQAGKLYQQAEATQVEFNLLTKEQLQIYYQTIPWQDKAGGYMVQLAGSLIVKKINGCFYNVMGLPINTLKELLQKVSIDLWNYTATNVNSKANDPKELLN